MSVFNNITKKVSDTAKAAAKKSGELVEVTKLNMSIGTEEDKIKKAYAEIGKLVFELYCKGEKVQDQVAPYCEGIAENEKNISEFKAKILALKNMKVCPSCGTELEIEIVFCSKCGTKQEAPAEEKAEEKIEAGS